MLFSSTVFLFGFLAAAVVLYYVTPRRYLALRNFWLFALSIVFYAWGEPTFVLVLLTMVVINWGFGLWVGSCRTRGVSCRLPLTLMAIVNLSLLVVYKYLGFLTENLNALLGIALPVPAITLPIGISFFTFQMISYVVDVSRGHGEAQRNVLNVGLYVAFFPQLIAGPIVRYETVAHQILHRRETVDDFSRGVCRFLWGLGKKVLLSNPMALIADSAFASASSVSFAWMGAIAYSLQIYFDFSGYSDMAIRLGAMFGFHFEENFNYPYLSRSITEFWRRWHISLGTFFRDYVYIPLGGSRVKGTWRLVRNLAVVWIMTGFWHGASWNFLLWGVFYFALLTIEKLFFSETLRTIETRSLPRRLLAHLYTLLAVLFGWVLFRAETLPAAGHYLATMFGLGGATLTEPAFFRYLGEKGIVFLTAILASFPIATILRDRYTRACQNEKYGRAVALCGSAVYPIVLLAIFAVSVSYLIKGSYNPFIYFNF